MDHDFEEESGRVTPAAAGFRNSVGEAFAAESALYEQFYDKITHHARTHREITMNNLVGVERRLSELKQKAAQLSDSIFFHEEEVVVERSKIIRGTESAVHEHNRAILDYERTHADGIVAEAADLSQSLLQAKVELVRLLQKNHLAGILGAEDYFQFFIQKSEEFQAILARHEAGIAKIFQSLDAEIEGMDTLIGKIIRDKNARVAGIARFYEGEMKHYWDNQYTYSAETDPTSIEIQAIASDKINQYNAFRAHSLSRDADVRGVVEAEYRAVYDRVFQHLLRRASYALVEKYDFFDDPERYLNRVRRHVADLAATKGQHGLKRAAKNLERLERWPQTKAACHRRAERMLARQLAQKRAVLLLAETDTAKRIGKLALSLDEYLAIIRIDPFLAQTLGDRSSQAIKDDRLDLSMLRVNRELKTNIDYDIQSAKIKSQINGLEARLAQAIERDMVAEEAELVEKIADINDYVVEHRGVIAAAKQEVARERARIARMERAVNVHLSWLVDLLNTDRMWLSLVFDELIKRVRQGETHAIYVTEARAEIDRLLKQYEMKAIHFRTVYENELAYLVTQKSRIGEETKINHAFILATYENQMRFASEQIQLAESEYRLRLEALTETVDSERAFHRAAIDNARNRFEKEIQLAEDEYDARLYDEAKKLEVEDDPKKRKSIQSEIDRERKLRDGRLATLVAAETDDETIAKSKRELVRLDDYLAEAVEDAERLRDETLREFGELYEYARARHDALKPYLEAAVDILDPLFFETLDRINERRRFELKLAEARLDERMGPLLDHYREVFFKQTESYDKAQYLELLDAIEASRERSEAVYRTGLEAVEAEYRERVAAIDAEANADADARDLARAEVKTRLESARAGLKQRDLEIETAAQATSIAAADALQKTISALTGEYVAALRQHRQISIELADDFARFLQANDRYVRLAMRQVGYRRIVLPIRKANRRKTRKALAEIHRRYRGFTIPTN